MKTAAALIVLAILSTGCVRHRVQPDWTIPHLIDKRATVTVLAAVPGERGSAPVRVSLEPGMWYLVHASVIDRGDE